MPPPCPSTRPVPVVSFHGTADPIDPYLGNGQKYWTYSVPEAASRWATHNGCDNSPERFATQTPPSLSPAMATAQGADRGPLLRSAGEGHEWPGGPHLPKKVTQGARSPSNRHERQ